MKNAQSLASIEMPAPTPAEQIRALNDTMRRNILNPYALGGIILTPAVAALSDFDRFALLDEVRCFEDFTPANDPYGEHDFGAINFHGEKYFWKIDYYDRNMRYHSPDPANAKLTHRILTIMRTDEY